jgi:hypothetical protein
MGLIREPDRLPSPVFPFSLGVLDTRGVDDQTKGDHTKCVLVGRRRQAVVFPAIEMTDCILEGLNSSKQAFIGALTGRLCPSTLSHDRL